MGKSWHQSAQSWLHGLACGLCHDAYAWSDQSVWPYSHLCSLKKSVSRVHGKIYVAWQHHWSVLSTSHGVLLMMRGTAECSARKTVLLVYPDSIASCDQDVRLSGQPRQV